MVAAALVIAGVLNELEAGQSQLIKTYVVGGSGVAERDGGESQIVQRRGPLLENVGGGRIAFGKDAQEFAGAVVGVEVGVKFLVFGLNRDRGNLLTQEFGHDLV